MAGVVELPKAVLDLLSVHGPVRLITGEGRHSVNASLAPIHEALDAIVPVSSVVIQDVMVGTHPGRVCKCIDGIRATIVILVEVLQIILGECSQIRAAGCKFGEDFVLVDRMRIVEADDAGTV